jgi:hypothetical protein
MVVHTYNPSHTGGIRRKITDQISMGKKPHKTLPEK